MKLNTTMGVELSFVPRVARKFMERNHKFMLKDPDEVMSGMDVICEGIGRTLRTVLRLRKIPFNACGRDPDCIEISTKPYKTTTLLYRAIEKIWHEAEVVECEPYNDWYVGGGFHIHTGAGSDEGMRQYKNRMFTFAALNPWLSWAFAASTDNINCAPISREHLIIKKQPMDAYEVSETKKIIARAREEMAERDAYLHDVRCRGKSQVHFNKDYCKERYELLRERSNRFKLKLARNDRVETFTELHMKSCDRIRYSGTKDYMLRNALEHGTIEFRMFEMQATPDDLKRYIVLVDAIVGYAQSDALQSVDIESIPTQEQLNTMTWRQRRDGFNAMLDTLGLKRDDYKRDRVQIALRLRYEASLRQKAAKDKAARLAASMDRAVVETSAALREAA